MGITVMDAGVVIGLLDASDTHHGAAQRAFDSARSRHDKVIIPASALAECLVAPARRGEAEVAMVLSLLEAFPIEVGPLDASVAVATAYLRARHGSRLRLPDALVIATAQEASADWLVTTDRRWSTLSEFELTPQLELI